MPLFNLGGNMASGLTRTDFTRVVRENPEAGDEGAGAAVFLASWAAAYVIGQTVMVDGGSTE